MSRFFAVMMVVMVLFVNVLPEARASLPQVEPWVTNLEIPWSLLFLDEERALVSERPGRIRLVKNGTLQEKPYLILDVAHVGEGGLMGLAKHPEYPRKPYIYAMHTYRRGQQLVNRVVRIRDEGDHGNLDRVILDAIPGGRFHNGGRIQFGPDGMLYITTGEIFQAELAQDLNSLGGKILRITPEGTIPPDNPFPQSPIYSYGHRNPQGLVWHPETGDLFASEHGPSGEFLRFGHDEINLIEKGKNYGWPEVIGRGGKASYQDPLILFVETTPPSGMCFYRGDLFVATLRSETLLRIRLQKDQAGYRVLAIEPLLQGQLGRLRDVVEGPDGALYVLTSNRDGRGRPRPNDDHIYRIIFP